MKAKMTVVDCATADGVFIVVGTKAEVRKAICENTAEWLHLKVLGEGFAIRDVDILNAPRQILLVGDEREVETEPETPQQGAKPGHVTLG